MPHFLVDLYPCKSCGKKVPVQSRREIEHASCERCAEFHRLWSCACSFAHHANERYDKYGDEKTEDLDLLLREMLEAVAEKARAASSALQAAQLAPTPAERAECGRWSKCWWRWSRDMSAQLDEMMEERAGELVFIEGVDGGASAPSPSRGVLRLVRPAEALPADVATVEQAPLERAVERWEAIRRRLWFRTEAELPAGYYHGPRDWKLWAFSFHGRPSAVAVLLWEGYSHEDLTRHRVSPTHTDLTAARVWAMAFARQAGFPALERVGEENRPLRSVAVASKTESA